MLAAPPRGWSGGETRGGSNERPTHASGSCRGRRRCDCRRCSYCRRLVRTRSESGGADQGRRGNAGRARTPGISPTARSRSPATGASRASHRGSRARARLRCRTSSSSRIRRRTSRCRASWQRERRSRPPRPVARAVAAASGSRSARRPRSIRSRRFARLRTTCRTSTRPVGGRPTWRSTRTVVCPARTAGCGSLPPAAACGARRTRSLPNPKWEYLSGSFGINSIGSITIEPQRLERQHALGRDG